MNALSRRVEAAQGDGVRRAHHAAPLASGPEFWKSRGMPKATVGIEQLSPQERLELIERPWDSLSDDDVPVTEAQRAEIDHRLDALDREGPVGVPWEQVLAEMGRTPN
jgi:putative addiction module component (TIGR02574 family)